MSRNVFTNTAIANGSDSYEIKIGGTVYVISHEYGDSDLSEIITDYLSDKTNVPVTDNHAA